MFTEASPRPSVGCGLGPRARPSRWPGFACWSAPPAAAETAQVTVGITRTATDVGWFIADKKGYFRDEGIEVKLIPFSSAAQMIVPLGSGQLDVGGGTVAAGLYNAIGRGIGLKVVADKGSIAEKYEYSTLLVRKDLVDSGRYRGLGDLKGMKIATAAQGAGSESSMNEALKRGRAYLRRC